MEDLFISFSYSIVMVDNVNASYSATDALIVSAFVGFAIGVSITGLAALAYHLYIKPLRAKRLAHVRLAPRPSKIHIL